MSKLLTNNMSASLPILFGWLGPDDCESFNNNHGFSSILFTIQETKFSKVILFTSCPEGMIYAQRLADQMVKEKAKVDIQVYYFADSTIPQQMAKTQEVVKLIILQQPEAPIVFCLSSGGGIASLWVKLRDKYYPQAQLIQVSQYSGLEVVDVSITTAPIVNNRDYLILGVLLTILGERLIHFLTSCLTSLF